MFILCPMALLNSLMSPKLVFWFGPNFFCSFIESLHIDNFIPSNKEQSSVFCSDLLHAFVAQDSFALVAETSVTIKAGILSSFLIETKCFNSKYSVSGRGFEQTHKLKMPCLISIFLSFNHKILYAMFFCIDRYNPVIFF